MQIGHIKTARMRAQRGLQFQGSNGDDGCLTSTDPDGHWFQLVKPEDH